MSCKRHVYLGNCDDSCLVFVFYVTQYRKLLCKLLELSNGKSPRDSYFINSLISQLRKLKPKEMN